MTKLLLLPKHLFLHIGKVYFLTALVFSCLFLYLSLNCYYSDSEIWLLALSQKVWNPGPLISIYYKWSFHALTNLMTFFVQESTQIYSVARFGWSTIALMAVLINTVFFSKIHGLKRNQATALFIFLLTSTLFFNQGFRIRGDILALFLHVFYLYFATDKKNRLWLLFAINTLLFLATPKSIYFICLQLALGFFYLLRNQKEDRQKSFFIFLSNLAPILIGLILIISLSLFSAENFLLKAITSAFDFYLKAFDTNLSNGQFLQRSDFQYIHRFSANSRMHLMIFSIWIFFFIKEIFVYKKSKWELSYFFQIYAALLIVFIGLHNQKLPFFLGPFLTPVFAQQASYLLKKLKDSWTKEALITLVLCFCCFLSWKQYSVNIRFNNNYLQQDFIDRLHNFKLKNPELKIFDIVGLLPKKNEFFIFVGPGESTNKESLLSQISSASPDVYIYTYKNVFLEPEIKQFLNKYYVSKEPGLWVKGKNLTLSTNPETFKKILQIKNVNYWVLPHPSETFIVNTTKNSPITDLIYLDQNMKLTQSESASAFVAIPISYLSFGLTNIESLGLKHSPFDLFRFDTSF